MPSLNIVVVTVAFPALMLAEHTKIQVTKSFRAFKNIRYYLLVRVIVAAHPAFAVVLVKLSVKVCNQSFCQQLL